MNLFHKILRIAVLCLAGLVVCVLMLPSCLFMPIKKVEAAFYPHSNIYFKTADGNFVNAWYVEPKSGHPTIVFSHGNGGNIGYFFDMLIPVATKGFGVFIYDYRGYGNSKGFTTENGMYNDMRGAVSFLNKEKKTPNDKIILWGLSIGGAVTSKIATEGEFRAVILQNTFTSIKDAASEIVKIRTGIDCLGTVSNICFYLWKFDTYSRIGDIDEKMLIIHSKDDEIIPWKLAAKNFAKSKNAELKLVENDGHNGYFEILPEVMKFLDSVK